MLCVAGDPIRDAVRVGWRLDLPHLFGPPSDKSPRGHVTSARRRPYIPPATA